MKTLANMMIVATLAAGLPAHALTRADLYGRAAGAATPARTVTIDAATRYVNVRQGDVVDLRAGAQRVTWVFDGIRDAVPLSAILPQAPDSAHVTVYVAIAPTS